MASPSLSSSGEERENISSGQAVVVSSPPGTSDRLSPFMPRLRAFSSLRVTVLAHLFGLGEKIDLDALTDPKHEREFASVL